ncbi:MAG: Cobalt/zinc/cadmium efflux transporter [Variovorax sp.]|nr:Cobalt/zinc/cadmium efflux transporter [Variovorax sp.]
MKRTIVLSVVGLAACGLVAWLLLRPGPLGTAAGAPAAAATPDVVAAVSMARPVRASVPVTVAAFGDVAPGQVQSVSFARPGQLAALQVVAGQRVRQGASLARLTSDPVAEAAYRQAQSALTLAEGEAQRTQALFALQLATTSQVETTRKAVQDARANVEAQQKLGGGIISADAKAPFDGVVVALNAAQGDRLAAGAPVLQLGRVDRLRVNLGIEPSERHLLRVGDDVALTVQQSVAATASGNLPKPLEAQGSIASLQDIVDPKTQLANAVVELSGGAAAALVPGMRVSARIRTGEQSGWLVARQALLRDEQGAYVFQVRDGVAHRVAVTALAEQGDHVSISGPLAEGLLVVTLGNYELSDGMKVREALR